ncbi:MAG: flagellin [Comamonas sp.]
MAMTINTNISSINAQRNLGLSGGSLATSMQRISSGLRVNSAKDDAAGLAISERMNSQVRGLTVAARNANDGISLAQTAEGALGKVGDMLGRMRDLAVQAGNSTNSASDREALQSEVDQLRSEIDRVAKTTTFNGQKILDGSFAGGVFQVGANSGDNITVKGTTKATADGLGNVTFGATTSKTFDSTKIEGLDKSLDGVKMVVGDKTFDLGSMKAASSGQERLGQIVSAINAKTADSGVTAYLQEGSESGSYTLAIRASGGNAVTMVGLESLEKATGASPVAKTNTYETELQGLKDKIAAFDPTAADAAAQTAAAAVITAANTLLQKMDGYNATPANSTGAAKALQDQVAGLKAVYTGSGWASGADGDAFATALKSFSTDAAIKTHVSDRNDALAKATAAVNQMSDKTSLAQATAAFTALNTARTNVGLAAVTTTAPVAGADDAATAKNIQTAALAVQKEVDQIGVNISGAEEISAHKGLQDLDISTQAGAWDALQVIDSAIDQVNSSRGDLGALQTRFEKSVENIDIMNENLSAARGRIVDADFAKETANLSRTQILQQAGTAMVAQANQLPQQVLSLLR